MVSGRGWCERLVDLVWLRFGSVCLLMKWALFLFACGFSCNLGFFFSFVSRWGSLFTIILLNAEIRTMIVFTLDEVVWFWLRSGFGSCVGKDNGFGKADGLAPNRWSATRSFFFFARW